MAFTRFGSKPTDCSRQTRLLAVSCSDTPREGRQALVPSHRLKVGVRVHLTPFTPEQDASGNTALCGHSLPEDDRKGSGKTISIPVGDVAIVYRFAMARSNSRISCC
jgi:hypothetical protein